MAYSRFIYRYQEKNFRIRPGRRSGKINEDTLNVLTIMVLLFTAAFMAPRPAWANGTETDAGANPKSDENTEETSEEDADWLYKDIANAPPRMKREWRTLFARLRDESPDKVGGYYRTVFMRSR